jgi:hypothetical protein
MQHPVSKIIGKRVGGVAWVVDHLPNKCKALSSKPQYDQRVKIKKAMQWK